MNQNPNDAQTPEYLFKMGEIYQFHQQYDKGIATYQTIVDSTQTTKNTTSYVLMALPTKTT
ncbi:MAG: hypothetical protein IPN94_16200 [Sphingobacteriales bacterium]|nr:hypothetical protein [Sphingobacteriales bacterium]